MRIVEPKVYLIAETHLRENDIFNWLIETFDYSPSFKDYQHDNPEDLAVLAGKRCYRSFAPGLNANVTKVTEDKKEYFHNILSSGHGSVLEHIQVTFAIEFVSRVLTHELVRHRIGVAISQESLRYVRLSKLDFYLPKLDGAHLGKQDYDHLIGQMKLFVRRAEALQKILASILDLDARNFTEKKLLTSALRRIAPMGLCTGLVWSCNMRALRHIITERTSRHAEEEIRYLFNLIGDIALEQWPLIFQDFKKVDTGDGLIEFVPEFKKI